MHELATFEVPRVSVDFLGDDLNSREKLTVLRYLTLEDEISSLGLQRFGPSTRDNIYLQPVREWVTENWDDEFYYDLSKRTLPITFRASLAIGLLTTRIREYLEKVGEIEVYGSRSAGRRFEEHGLESPLGLTSVDYNSLPLELRNKLVPIMIDDLKQAQLVAKAGLMFPQGVDRMVAGFVDPAFLMQSVLGLNEGDIIRFDKVRELESQAEAAQVCLDRYQEIKEMQPVIKKSRESIESSTEDDNPIPEELEIPEELDDLYFKKYQDVHYESGTSFFDVFPLKEGESKEDILRAYNRIISGDCYFAEVIDPSSGEYFEVRLFEDGRLVGHYGYADDYGGFRRDVKFRKELDMLSDRLDEYGTLVENNRRGAILNLVSDLRREIDLTKEIVEFAQTHWGQTQFTVEMGFLENLTDRSYHEATAAEIEEDKRLIKEILHMFGMDDQTEESVDSVALTVYSDQPIDKRVVALDYRILSVIKYASNLSLGEISALMMGQEIDFDNIGKLFIEFSSLLSKYKGVLVDISEAFATLGIPPTNDPITLRRAWNAVALETHPDRVPEEEREASVLRFKAALEAYATLKNRVEGMHTDRLAPTYYLGRISKLFDHEDASMIN